MAGYNPNENTNEYFSNEYINFNQFLQQHNIVPATQFYGNNAPYGFGHQSDLNSTDVLNEQQVNTQLLPIPIQYFPSSGLDYSPLMPPMQHQLSMNPLNDGQFDAELARNSNLLPTANEFVPNFAMPVNDLLLFPNAYDMIQQPIPLQLQFNQQYIDPSLLFSYDVNQFLPNSVYNVNLNDNNNDFEDIDNVSMNKTDFKEQPVQEQKMLRALQSTRIGDTSTSDMDTNSNRAALNSVGGAIKKIRPINNENLNGNNSSKETQDKISDNRSDRAGNRHSPISRSTGQQNGHNDHRFDHRRNERHYENRRTGTGRTASQFDSSDRHNQKGEYSHIKNNSAESSSFSRSNSNLENKWNSKHNNTRDRKQNEPLNKKIDELKVKKLSIKFEKLNFSNFSQREKLIREIDAGRLECLVCCEMIKPFHSVWSCSNCYHIMHLNCVIKWAASSKSEEGWRCCACQNVKKTVPRDYYCFCGKQRNPQYNRSDVAHTCGDICNKAENCPHSCTQLCHPGPCPSCQATVTRKCGCGRTEKIMQCCQKDNLQCENVCDKDMNCGVHKCLEKCHAGACDTCEQEVEHTCYCERNKKTMPCTKENNENLTYACAKLCNKLLNCGNHKCKDICHPGKCTDCKLTPDVVKTCPCGKMRIEPGTRKSCKDPIPVCTGNCKKPLQCGQPNNPHLCPSKCHSGPCPQCNRQTSVKCRCGHMDQMIKCSELSTRADDARCKKRCAKKRNCGKHKCNQECCIDIDHICPLPCNFNLSCGKHKCDQTCHKGRCQPCYRSSFDELYCECGANVIYPPVPCGTKKPACDKPCTRTHACDHPVTHNCHSGAQCPPCMAFTTKYCHGKHEQRKIIPCSQSDFSCGLPCNKPLKCGQHKCIKTCHAGVCETEDEICKQNCLKLRVMCSHNCNAPCHPNKPCPDTPCRETVEVLCQCGLRKQTRTCYDFSTEYRKIATAKFASSMQDMQRGGTVELSDVLGPIKLANNKTLECNEECKVAERNRKLAIGLQIRNPDIPSKLQPKYSDFIRSWAKKDPKLVTMIHDKLTELVKLAKESKQKSRSHSFPTMNREKRQLVHEMCAMFGVESVAYDAEPNRNVVANATRDTSWLPSMGIMEVIQRESGQRRIPVPSLNAWGTKRV